MEKKLTFQDFFTTGLDLIVWYDEKPTDYEMSVAWKRHWSQHDNRRHQVEADRFNKLPIESKKFWIDVVDPDLEMTIKETEAPLRPIRMAV